MWYKFQYYFLLFFLRNYLLIFGCVCCLLLHGLFSSCGKQGLLFIAVHEFLILIVVASLLAEQWLQMYGLQQLQHVGSVVAAPRLQSTGLVVVAHELSCSVATPALAGRFFTTDPPGKPCFSSLLISFQVTMTFLTNHRSIMSAYQVRAMLSLSNINDFQCTLVSKKHIANGQMAYK